MTKDNPSVTRLRDSSLYTKEPFIVAVACRGSRPPFNKEAIKKELRFLSKFFFRIIALVIQLYNRIRLEPNRIAFR